MRSDGWFEPAAACARAVDMAAEALRKRVKDAIAILEHDDENDDMLCIGDVVG